MGKCEDEEMRKWQITDVQMTNDKLQMCKWQMTNKEMWEWGNVEMTNYRCGNVKMRKC